ncbi:MAG: FG-GAP-like repeat-containing protein [Chthonomonadales bacterium]
MATALCISSLIGCGGRKNLATLPKDDPALYTRMVRAFTVVATALRVGDQKRAQALAPEPTKLVPEEPAGWANLALTYLRATGSDTAAAGKALAKALEIAPANPRLLELRARLMERQGKLDEAMAQMRKAIQADPSNVRLRYGLVQMLQRRQDAASDQEQLDQLREITLQRPRNLLARLELALLSARTNNASALAEAVAGLDALTAGWPAGSLEYLKELKTAAKTSPQQAAVSAHFLLNVLKQTPAYQRSSAEIATPAQDVAPPLEHFIVPPNPPSTPAPPDMGLTFTPRPVPGLAQTGVCSAVVSAVLAPELPQETAREFQQELGAPARPQGSTAYACVRGQRLEIASAGQHLFLPFPAPPTQSASGGGRAAVLFADWSYHFRPDLVMAGHAGLRLYHQRENGSFVDATPTAHIPDAIRNRPLTGVWAADIEGDGALDLIPGFQDGRPVVLRNNGDGTFAPQYPFAGVSGVEGFCWGDVTGDGDPDAVVIDGKGRLHVFENERSGRFEPLPSPPTADDVLAVTLCDLERDATFQILALTRQGSITEFRFDPDTRRWSSRPVAQWAGPPVDGSARLFMADLDNNGAPDIVATGSSGTRIWLVDGSGTAAAAPMILPASDVNPTPPTPDGRIDLVGKDAKGEPVYLAGRGTKNYGWFLVRPRARYKAKERPGQSTGDRRINTFGVGGAIEVRAGLLSQKTLVDGPDVHFGLGSYTTADIVRILWPNGVLQAEFDTGTEPVQPLKTATSLVAIERLIGSCPWLYAWDGHKMTFITDILFSSPLGLRINAQGTASSTTTRDWVKVEGTQLAPRDGFYDLRVTGELWETHFFDMVQLLAVDHPADTEIYVDERFVIPPAPKAVHLMTIPQPVARALDQDGRDVTDLVRARDGKYLDTFRLGDYQGIAQDHYVQIELGPDPPGNGRLWLVAQGWLHPTDSSINLAISSGHHDIPRPVSLEVPDGHGGWKTVRPNLGFPAGKNKTCLVDLTGIFKPGGRHELRLRTNMEVYWDFLGTARELSPAHAMDLHALKPYSADLRFRGFSVVKQAGFSSPELPEYEALWSTGQPWRDLVGYYTRYGDVKELVARVDDRYVILNAGDELALRFPALAAPRPGIKRDFVFISDGWEKDGNVNTGFSRTVLPLPSHTDRRYAGPLRSLDDDPVYRAHRGDWERYHTRYVSPYQALHALMEDDGRQ